MTNDGLALIHRDHGENIILQQLPYSIFVLFKNFYCNLNFSDHNVYRKTRYTHDFYKSE